MWIIAMGMTEVSENVPVLLSANVDVKSLLVDPGNHNVKRAGGTLRFSGKWAVAVYKDGDTRVFSAKNSSLADVYKRSDFVIPKGFSYLVP